jgi:transcription elongation factor GreA
MEKLPMTAGGLQRLQEELKTLKGVERRAVIKAISEAREHGDLSENAEYHAARERQGFIEGHIKELEDKIARAEVIDIKSLSGKVIKFGATVTLSDEETNEQMTYQIVGVDEADIGKGLLSISSPLARALIGKTVGDSCDITTPKKGHKFYDIMEVIYS